MVDYTSSHMLVPIIKDDVQTYASVNAIMYNEDGQLANEGSYFVYILHPGKGSSYFTLEYDYTLERWISRDAVSWVGEDIMKTIIDKLPPRT